MVTAGAPSALVPRLPDGVRVLSLEDRADPVVQLGSLVNADTANRLTVVFDGADHVAGARAADAAAPPATPPSAPSSTACATSATSPDVELGLVHR